MYKSSIVFLFLACSILWADIKLERPQYVENNEGKAIDIAVVVPNIKNRNLSVLSLMKPNAAQQARDAHFRTVKGYENIMLGLIKNLDHWGRVSIKKRNVIILKNVKVVSGLTLYIDHDRFVIYDKKRKVKDQRNLTFLRKAYTEQTAKISQLEKVVATQQQKIQHLEKVNEDIWKAVHDLQAQVHNLNKEPIYNRKVLFDFTYDENPPKGVNYQVKIAPTAYPQDVHELKLHDMVLPGTYNIEISIPGYKVEKYELNVESVDKPLVLKRSLHAKPRKLLFQVQDSNKRQLSGYNVTLTYVPTNKKLKAFNNDQRIPGWYIMDIAKPGYAPINKKIYIMPGEGAYTIQEVLTTAKRTLSFRIRDKNSGVNVTALETIDVTAKKPLTNTSWYTPYQNVRVMFKFREYATKEIIVSVQPGSGPYQVDIWLTNRWKKLDFSARYDKLDFDGIVYPAQFVTDVMAIEDHHITNRNVGGYYYYEVMVPARSKTLTMSMGYLYNQMDLRQFMSGMAIGRMSEMNIDKLIAHVGQLRKKDISNAVIALENMLRSRRFVKRWKGVSFPDKQRFIQHLKSWTVKNSQMRIRLQITIYTLSKSSSY